MQSNQVSQNIITQLPLTFAGYGKMTSPSEKANRMDAGKDVDLQERIRYLLRVCMPGPDRGKQVRLAKIADESKQVVNHWLTGKTLEIQYEAARRISDHFGLRMDWVMRGKGPVHKDDKEESATTENMALVYLTTQEQEIVTAFRSTDAVGQTVIAAAAMQMKKI